MQGSWRQVVSHTSTCHQGGYSLIKGVFFFISVPKIDGEISFFSFFSIKKYLFVLWGQMSVFDYFFSSKVSTECLFEKIALEIFFWFWKVVNLSPYFGPPLSIRGVSQTRTSLQSLLISFFEVASHHQMAFFLCHCDMNFSK